MDALIGTREVIERLRASSLRLLPEVSTMTPEELHNYVRAADTVVCDFYITGAEFGQEIPGGYRIDGIDNIDHHANTPRMRRHVSSTNLAIDYVNERGPVHDRPVVIHHTDCDSVLSSAIVAGVLPPDQVFGEAAIAADHTGEKNDIADLLQSLHFLRDPEFSLSSLAKMMQGKNLPHEALQRLHSRQRERRLARESADKGVFRWKGGLAYGRIEAHLDTALVPPVLPDAQLVMIYRENVRYGPKWRIKLRLGRAAPEGMSLLELGINEFDPSFGGRWNAGSNRRAGGTDIEPEAYATKLSERLERWHSGRSVTG